jgi:DNA-directed RNA polymerase specialized sigma24 family protein
MSVDERGFREWYAAERDGVARALVVIGGDPDLAVEAVAEAFSRAYQHWGRVRGMTSRTGWVYRVALNDMRRWAGTARGRRPCASLCRRRSR